MLKEVNGIFGNRAYDESLTRKSACWGIGNVCRQHTDARFGWRGCATTSEKSPELTAMPHEYQNSQLAWC